ncbi:putative ATP-dependent RNA helicase spindle-E [Glossina fuscipes fuscipes]
MNEVNGLSDKRKNIEQIDLLGLDDTCNSIEQSLPGSNSASSKIGKVIRIHESSDESQSEYNTYNSPQSKVDKNDVYDRYHFDLERNKSLPIHDYKDEIVANIKQNPVTILEGDIGCGKTTQVPQYIIDDAYSRREYCKIVCTQPRKIAAISLANRICVERNWPQDSLVAYQIGLNSNVSEDTRLLFCTTGVLLQQLVHEKSLKRYTHIILDEVHERDQEMDFLLFLIRRLLTTNSKHVKIVLMSATINATEFSNYFKVLGTPAPIVKAGNHRMFETLEFYFCDLSLINPKNFRPNYNNCHISEKMYKIAFKLIGVCNNIEKKLSELNKTTLSPNKASILIFLPGIYEIFRMNQVINECNDVCRIKLHIIRLHSLIPPNEQLNVFHRSPPGYRKVILSTNIAESSVTVPDVKYVIDFCLTKLLTTNSGTNFTSLQLQWASRVNCRQRAGRAGRVMDGRVYRLVERSFYEKMNEFVIPEMVRCPLENVILKAKILDMGQPCDILRLTMTPPNLKDICNTILTLKELGALYKTVDGSYSIQDGDITYIGRIMANFPLSIHLTRLIVLGYIFGVLDDAIIMAAGLSVRSVFVLESVLQQNNIDAYIQKLVWANGSGSDLFAILRAYKTWTHIREQSGLRDEIMENHWAERFFVNLRSIKEMHLLVRTIYERLDHCNLNPETSAHSPRWTEDERAIVLKIIIAGAFYPNYFTRTNLNDFVREHGIYHILCGNDPCNTVYFTNFDNRLIGQLYTRSFKDLFKSAYICPEDIEVRFQPGSQRVFITFNNEANFGSENIVERLMVPGRVRPEIYKAIRMRMSRMTFNLNVMNQDEGIKYALKHGYGSIENGVWRPNKQSNATNGSFVLPTILEKNLIGFITHIENCSKFFFLPMSEFECLREIDEILNRSKERNLCSFDNIDKIYNGMIVSAPLNGRYCRAKVLHKTYNKENERQFKLFFIDNGYLADIHFTSLRRIPEKYRLMPPRVFECRLAMVQPSTVKSSTWQWSKSAKQLMENYTKKNEVHIEVYSVVYGIANVFIKLENITLNDLLVQKQYASRTEENYLSKTDHDLRLRKQILADYYKTNIKNRKSEDYMPSLPSSAEIGVDHSPPTELCNKVIKLRGPYSPLETRIFSATNAGCLKSTQIEGNSVNSVLIDTDPQDVHERLIVAADVTENASNSIIIGRDTTLMPNIHGFAALVTMMFCPTMQIERNRAHTKYINILAGLGYDEHTFKPLYGEHDLILNLDAEFDTDDFQLINHLRYSMDAILYAEPGDQHPNISPGCVGLLQTEIKDVIVKLLKKNRKYIGTNGNASCNIWKRSNDDEVFENVNVFGDRSIFPMHSVLRLKRDKPELIHDLLLHCEELHNLRQLDSVRNITCRLCNQHLNNASELRIHLLTQLHCDREQEIHFKPP